MRILYAIQGTGNGHLSRAKEIIPILNRYCEVKILVSGYDSEVELPFPIDYRRKGLSFIFGSNGGIDYWKSYLEASFRSLKKEINTFPIEQFDAVINDFEPISAWAAKRASIPCIALSHQAAVLDEQSPKPLNTDFIGRTIMEKYAPFDYSYGFHFESYSPKIFSPVIRQEIRQLLVKERTHYLVYLPAFSETKQVEFFSQLKGVKWHIFSKRCKKAYKIGSVSVKPISNTKFLTSLCHAKGVICGAGFELPAEVLYLKKKLLVIPMKGQYEQQCNAMSLSNIGVPVLKDLKKKRKKEIRSWIKSEEKIAVNYSYQIDQIIDLLFTDLVCNLSNRDKIHFSSEME